MALFECPECGRSISDMARTCPGCGAPVALIKPKDEKIVQSNSDSVQQPVSPAPQIDVRIVQNEREKKKESWRGFWILLIAAGLGVFYSVYSICYWSDAGSMANGFAESIGAGIATAAVMPHLICAVLATFFNVIALFCGAGFALASAILYTVSAVIFLPYFMFVIIQAILCYIGFARKRKHD